MSADPRATYLAQTAAAVIGNPEMASQIGEAPEMTQFLNELNCTVLQVISDGAKFRCFANKVANVPPGTLEVHFVKVWSQLEYVLLPTGYPVNKETLPVGLYTEPKPKVTVL